VPLGGETSPGEIIALFHVMAEFQGQEFGEAECEQLLSGDHRGGGQRQHRRHRMIPALARSPVAHPGEQFQQVTAIRCRAGGRQPPACQVIGEPGYQPPVRHTAATGNDTIEHGEAPAGEGLWEDTS
jgi:hypothetical protein